MGFKGVGDDDAGSTIHCWPGAPGGHSVSRGMSAAFYSILQYSTATSDPTISWVGEASAQSSVLTFSKNEINVIHLILIAVIFYT